ncbi:unnamed protein product [Caenorhabditis bovis]|uniref:Domain of unknown function DB domain-containing protein n=1 Tax=Caenorhabditis bovis TaxID=2654633 RepID=A0A8S1EG63_9PELO|nr:unnamed protein product [Caenorhabditis bovis]
MSAVRFTVYAFALLALIEISLACFASGICGGGCPPPPPPVCMGGCGGGYACGRYGCARARGSKTLTIKDEKEMTPDEKFMRCCEERNLPDSCLTKCTFRTYTKAALQAMYFKQDQCPMQAAADIQYCAAQGRNITQLDMSYLACYDRFENMKACFWQDIMEKSAPAFSFNTDDEISVQPNRGFALTGSRTFQARTFGQK